MKVNVLSKQVHLHSCVKSTKYIIMKRLRNTIKVGASYQTKWSSSKVGYLLSRRPYFYMFNLLNWAVISIVEYYFFLILHIVQFKHV